MNLLTAYSYILTGRFTEEKYRRTLDNYLAFFGPDRIRSLDIVAAFTKHGVSYGALCVEAQVTVINIRFFGDF